MFFLAITDEQRDWLDAQVPPGGTRAQIIRQVIQAEMERERLVG